MMPKQEVSVEDSDRISTPTFFARYFSLTCMPSQKSMFHCGEVSVSMKAKVADQWKINARCTICAGRSSMETKASPFALRRILPPDSVSNNELSGAIGKSKRSCRTCVAILGCNE